MKLIGKAIYKKTIFGDKYPCLSRKQKKGMKGLLRELEERAGKQPDLHLPDSYYKVKKTVDVLY